MKTQLTNEGVLHATFANIICGETASDDVLALLSEADEALARKLMATAMSERATVFENEIALRPNAENMLKAVFAHDPSDAKLMHPIQNSTNGRLTETGVQLIPVLPNYARLSELQVSEGKNAGGWVDEYIDFASKASPLTPSSFHEAGALYICSLAIARRVCLEVSTSSNTIYPNLYLLFVGQSTRSRKTTGKRLVNGLIQQAGLSHFLLAERQTPEALLFDLSMKLPRNLAGWREEERDEWLRERAIAAQRGWLLEEASHLLDSFNRDYTSGLLPIVLDLHDASEFGTSRHTISRGRERVERPYMTILGATTFEGVLGHMDNKTHWNNGLFARFAFVLPDESGEWSFWPEPMSYPSSLVSRLRFTAYDLLPMPAARLNETENRDDGGQHFCEVVLDAPLVSNPVKVGEDAWRQWEQYARAVSYDMLPEQPQKVPSRLYASYGRLGTMMIKVAMILATFDTEELPIRVEARHVYRAQSIAERWRANLHKLFTMTGNPSDNGLAEQVELMLGASELEWMARRDLLRKLNKTWAQIESIVVDLEASGEIERRPRQNQRGPASEEYRLLR